MLSDQLRTSGAALVGVILLAMATAGEGVTPKTMKNLAFLTREGCVNTPDMMFNLDDALKALKWPADYQFIDIGRLPKTDARTGYPTPTLLWNGRDIFGMPAPTPPFPEPS